MWRENCVCFIRNGEYFVQLLSHSLADFKIKWRVCIFQYYEVSFKEQQDIHVVNLTTQGPYGINCRSINRIISQNMCWMPWFSIKKQPPQHPPPPMTLCKGTLGKAPFQTNHAMSSEPRRVTACRAEAGNKPSHMHPLPVTQEGRVHEEGGEYFLKSSTKLWRTSNMLKKSIIELCHYTSLTK